MATLTGDGQLPLLLAISDNGPQMRNHTTREFLASVAIAPSSSPRPTPIENYLVAPRVFARAVELSPVAAFVAVLVGASLGGLLGAVTALPITAVGRWASSAADPDPARCACMRVSTR